MANVDGKWRNAFLWLTMLLVLTSIFYRNTPSLVNQTMFSDFQKESEALVIGKIAFDKTRPGVGEKANLWRASSGDAANDPVNLLEGYDLLNQSDANITFRPYVKSVGLQGSAYSFLYNDLAIDNLKQLNLISAGLTAICLLLITWGFSKSVGKGFAIAFLLSISLSPWVISFARNLFWSPFLWFAPAMFSLMTYVFNRYWYKYAFLGMVFVSVLIKALCGYEYISTIIWFSCAVFLIDPFLREPRLGKAEAIKTAGAVFLLGVAGFLSAIILHANIRGDTVIDGLMSIWEQDVLRRTYGTPSSFGPIYADSLTASPFLVLKEYVVWRNYHAPLLYGVSGSYFVVLIAFSLATIFYKFKSGNWTRWRDLGLFCIFVVGPVSWFVLAKAHSYIHMPLSFVLWYFGFVAAILYISFNGFVIIAIKFSRYIRNVDERAI